MAIPAFFSKKICGKHPSFVYKLKILFSVHLRGAKSPLQFLQLLRLNVFYCCNNTKQNWWSTEKLKHFERKWIKSIAHHEQSKKKKKKKWSKITGIQWRAGSRSKQNEHDYKQHSNMKSKIKSHSLAKIEIIPDLMPFFIYKTPSCSPKFLRFLLANRSFNWKDVQMSIRT